MTVKNAALSSRVARLGGLHVLGRADDRDRGGHVLSEADLGTGPPGSAGRLDRQAVARHGVVTDLVQPGRGELKLWRRPPADGFPPPAWTSTPRYPASTNERNSPIVKKYFTRSPNSPATYPA